MLLLFFNIVFGLVLIGCSDNVDNGTRVADYYSGLSTMNVLADINANFGDYFVDFQLEFKYNAQGESIIEVKKPSEIEGVKVRFVDDEIILDYEGVSLEMGPSENSAISPVGALPELLRVWRDGMVSDQGHEKVDGTDCIYISHKATRDSVEIQYCTWFDAESLKPIKAEINEDGHRKILCTYLIAEKFE
jgi:outer membrane lipoprotein-sorting protein